jgi:SAM-dependent methyltransferase
MAREVGITDASAESLRRFDAAFLDMYPYLEGYLPAASPAARGLEIGLGYGTLSQLLAKRAGDYHGLDIAAGPVAMVRHRLSMMGIDDPERRVVQGSALSIPHRDASFDYVYTIGCLHHTGNIPRGVSELRRVLRPGGKFVVMLYNRHSARQLRKRLLRLARRRGGSAEHVRASYDVNAAGEPAPTTQFVSVRDAARLFAWAHDLRIDRQNFDSLSVTVLRGRLTLLSIPREKLLTTAGRWAGLDLYIVGTK